MAQPPKFSILINFILLLYVSFSFCSISGFLLNKINPSSRSSFDTKYYHLEKRSTRLFGQISAENKQFKQWVLHNEGRKKIHYQVIATPAMEEMAKKLEQKDPDRFHYHQTKWNKFPDGTDNIEVGGFNPNVISGEHVIFLGSFNNNDTTLSQLQVIIMLLQSFIESLTIYLPFYPVGTMERTVKEGCVATANTYSLMLSNLPFCGKPTRVMIFDIHTLQNRFYLSSSAIANLHSAIPLLKDVMYESNIDCIAFPDDGAAKRFKDMFSDLDVEIVICGKTRIGDERKIIVQSGDCKNKNVVIVDDLVQSGTTLHECGKTLRTLGANGVNAFVSHAVFPNESYKRFLIGGDRHVFDKFWVTNSIPTVTDLLPKDDVFEVLDLTDLFIDALDRGTV